MGSNPTPTAKLKMNEIEKELAILSIYLDTGVKKDILVEVVWFAFDYKKKNPSWHILKCFEKAIWDWLLYTGKKEHESSLKDLSKKIKEMNKKLKD